jgi:hypothetical protein
MKRTWNSRDLIDRSCTAMNTWTIEVEVAIKPSISPPSKPILLSWIGWYVHWFSLHHLRGIIYSLLLLMGSTFTYHHLRWSSVFRSFSHRSSHRVSFSLSIVSCDRVSESTWLLIMSVSDWNSVLAQCSEVFSRSCSSVVGGNSKAINQSVRYSTYHELNWMFHGWITPISSIHY